VARWPRRDLFLQVLEQVRQRYRFVVVGYVVMAEHIHLLISEPEKGDPSVVMKVVKQEFARMVHRRDRVQSRIATEKVWQRRFYDPSAPLRISAAGSDAR
jgi:putative transposase